MGELLREIAGGLKEMNANLERMFDLMPIIPPINGINGIYSTLQDVCYQITGVVSGISSSDLVEITNGITSLKATIVLK